MSKSSPGLGKHRENWGKCDGGTKSEPLSPSFRGEEGVWQGMFLMMVQVHLVLLCPTPPPDLGHRTALSGSCPGAPSWEGGACRGAPHCPPQTPGPGHHPTIAWSRPSALICTSLTPGPIPPL